MRKLIYILLLSILLCASSSAQSSGIVSEISPKLKKFLSDNPGAAKKFTNTIANVFSNRTMQLFYFYSDAGPEAFHYHPRTIGQAGVIICVRENDPPLDEFIHILFETLNSTSGSEDKFSALTPKVYSGTVSREQFAKQILQREFEAIQKTRSALLTLKLKKKMTDESLAYRSLVKSTNFDDFVSKNSQVYELTYDSMQKMYNETNSASNSTAPKN